MDKKIFSLWLKDTSRKKISKLAEEKGWTVGKTIQWIIDKYFGDDK